MALYNAPYGYLNLAYTIQWSCSMSAASNAVKQFDDNIRRFAHPSSEPERYNLYAGLANLARTLEQQASLTAELSRRVEQLERSIRQKQTGTPRPTREAPTFTPIEFTAD